VEPIASLLRAILILLGKLHEREIAWGDEPGNCLLSSVKNGHGMTWPAWIEFNDQKFAVELGSAAHSMEQGAEYHTEHAKLWMEICGGRPDYPELIQKRNSVLAFQEDTITVH
jgi:hypothetical protein